MKILVLSPRFPEVAGKGDQDRAMSHISYLARRHEVTVLAGRPPMRPLAVRELEALATVRIQAASTPERVASAIGAVLRGQPAQVGWLMPPKLWREAIRLAAEQDVVLAIYSRSLRGSLPPPTVLDHIDTMSVSMRNRARFGERWYERLAARFEANRLRSWERRLAPTLAAQVVTTDELASELPTVPTPIVVPTPRLREIFDEPPDHERDIDVIFTGDFVYWPNRDAARWLDHEIMPLVLQRRPGTRALLVGRAATRLEPKHMSTASDVPDMLAYLRRAKVAAVALREGRGQGTPTKALEAAASGAALVACAWTVRPYGMRIPTAEDAPTFASAIVELLEDEEKRAATAAEGYATVRKYAPETAGAVLEAALEHAAGARRVSAAGAPGVVAPRRP